MRGGRLPPRGVGLVALLDGAGALLQQVIGAFILRLAELKIGGIEFDRTLGRREVLLRGSKLTLLHLQHRLVDCHLLAIVGVVEPRDQCAGVDPLPFVEWKLDDARLHGLETEHALVRLDVAGHQDRRRLRLVRRASRAGCLVRNSRRLPQRRARAR